MEAEEISNLARELEDNADITILDPWYNVDELQIELVDDWSSIDNEINVTEEVTNINNNLDSVGAEDLFTKVMEDNAKNDEISNHILKR